MQCCGCGSLEYSELLRNILKLCTFRKIPHQDRTGTDGRRSHVRPRARHEQKWLGVIFAIFTAISAFGIGNMVQANSISTMVHETFRIAPWITGALMAVLTAFVILGGIKSIAKVCEALVPFMAIFYVGGCFILLLMNASGIPATIQLIFHSAFTGHAMFGGFAGATMKEAIRYGVARGLFSNESGLGSAPIVAAAAQTKNPVRQALVSSTGTFWDTVVVCAMTGLVLVNSGEWIKGSKAGPHQSRILRFSHRRPDHPHGRAVDVCFFHHSWLVYYGEKAAEYLLGPKVITPYRWLWVGAVLMGSLLSLRTVWSLADVTNGLMAIPNLISLIALNGVIVAETRHYLWNNNLDADAPPLEG